MFGRNENKHEIKMFRTRKILCLRGLMVIIRNDACILVAGRAIIRATISAGDIRLDIYVSTSLSFAWLFTRATLSYVSKLKVNKS